MNNPFKPGDTVYILGSTTKRTVSAICDDLVSFVTGGGGWYPIHMVSFDPWPEPNHVRKIDVGYWLALPAARQFQGRECRPLMQVMYWDGTGWLPVFEGGRTGDRPRSLGFTPFKFLGAEL